MFDLTRAWYAKSLQPITILLLPFSWLFRFCIQIRRFLYRVTLIKSHRFNVPVIVVGNITVGGTGKTPFVIWLATFLRTQGYRPGIVSRGVGGEKHTKPHRVQKNDAPAHVGDEAILLATKTNCPVVICVDRAAAVRDLLLETDCNIVISDDGLQHYRLARDIEISLVDGERRFGNQQLLPAGPLREPLKRLEEVDFIITNAGHAQDDYVMTLNPLAIQSIQDAENKINITDIKVSLDPAVKSPDDGELFPQKVHAVAGIGHPKRFFTLLEHLGLEIIPHVFPDHYLYRQKDLEFNDALPVVMTEKDAVKCRAFADERYWFLAVQTKIDNRFEEKLLTKIKSIQTLEVGYANEKVLAKCSTHDTNNECNHPCGDHHAADKNG